MNTRKLVTGLVAAGVLSLGLGASVFPASADMVQRTVVVTLKDGKTMSASVTVAAGSGCDPSTVGAAGANAVAVTCQDTPVAPPPPPAPTATAPATTPTTTGPTTTTPTKPKPKPDPKPQPKPEDPAADDGGLTLGGGSDGDGGQKIEDAAGARERERPLPAPTTTEDQSGQPTTTDPTASIVDPGAAPIGVPNFFIEKFRIPPFLLPIYQAAGIQYGIPWQVLAAINEIETDYGRNLSVSSAGALGWMQFMPPSWEAYGVDANGDGKKDPYNPVDAIFAAARYLKAADASKDLRRAIFAYNHADWYVDSVMLRARLIGGMPADLVGALTGLTSGRFPVAARSIYAGSPSAKEAKGRPARGSNAANVVSGKAGRTSIDIFAKAGSPVIAVNDGEIRAIGQSKKLGRYIVLQDVYGNRYTYSQLGQVASSYPAPKERAVSAAQIRAELKLPDPDPKPKRAASAGAQQTAPAPTGGASAPKSTGPPTPAGATKARTSVAKERLFAHPARARSFKAGGEQQLTAFGKPIAGFETYDAYFKQVLGLKREDVELKPLRVGAQVVAGTLLGRIEKTDAAAAAHLAFQVRPVGRGAPFVDPKPILDGWKLLESTAVYRAKGKNPFAGSSKNPSIGQILLMSKEELERRVLADPRIKIYECGRRDIRAGQIDRRVLATLAFFVASGMNPTVSSLTCGHSYLTKAGGVSAHSSGNALDVAAINGIPIYGHQGKGSITDMAVRRLLTLQGVMKPHQIITLYKYPGTDNTLALGDHDDHIHIGFQPGFSSNGKLGKQFNAILKPDQWTKLIDRLGEIDNPTVPVKPSKYSIPDDGGAAPGKD